MALDREYVPDQTAAVVQEAQELYGANVTVYNATDPLFSDVFPNHQLKIVESIDGEGVHLNHAMAYRAVTQTGYDLTRNFTALMVNGGVTLTTSVQALKVGKLYATMANAEIQLERKIAFAGNSTELNHTISDPAATAVLGGWRVTLTTWGPMWGALINWTIDFGTASIASSDGNVLATARGGYDADLGAIFVRENMSMKNDYVPNYGVALYENGTKLVAPWDTAGLERSLIANATTFDGSIVRVTYLLVGETVPTGAYLKAQLLADSLAWAYDRTIQASIAPKVGSCSDVSGNQTSLAYKYFIKDSDCVLEIVLRDDLIVGSPMNFAGSPTSVKITATGGYRVALTKAGYTPHEDACNDDCLTRLILTHELFHGIQRIYALGVYNEDWDIVEEGMNRMRETLAVAQYAQVNGSPWYKDVEYARSTRTKTPNPTSPPDPDSQYVVDYSQRDFCALSYYTAGYWGSVYQRNGGMDTLNDIMRRASDNKTATCLNTFPGIIDNALALANENETTFNASLVEYAIRLYEKNFSWGDPYNGNATQNWSVYQADVPAHNASQTPEVDVPGYGFQYFTLPTNRTYNVKCESPGAVWDHHLIKRSASMGWQSPSSLTCGTNVLITGTDWSEVILIAVRLDKVKDKARVTITEV